MATAESIGYGIGDAFRRNKDRIKQAAVNAVVPTTALVVPASQVATASKEFVGGVARGASGAPAPEVKTQAPVKEETTATPAAPQAQSTAQAPAQSIKSADNVATQPVAAPVSRPQVTTTPATDSQAALGVRKIVDPSGATSYTNDPQQTGGQPMDARGALSVVGDPRTEGMTQAQAAAYWQNQSDQIDARQRREELERQADMNIVSPTDSIGTIQAKRMNQQRIQRELNLGVNREQAFAERGENSVPKVNSAQEQEAIQLGIRSKRLEVGQQEQVDKLRQRYVAETDPEKKRQLASQINALTGKDQQKFQVVTEKGVGADGITPTQTAYLVDEAGNVKPVSAGGQPDPNIAPPGMRMVGTSQGKPVYEDAQGNRFTLD
jgi:hypothetical protein